MSNYNWKTDLPREKLIEMIEGGRLVESGLRAQLKEATAPLERIVKYAHEDRATTPGVTRLARVLMVATDFLSRTPAQPTAPAADECHPAYCAHLQPAAPEPSAEPPTAGCHDALDYIPGETDRQCAVRWMRKCLSAEAQLAAVRKCFAKLPSPDQLRADKRLTLDQKHELAVLVTALLTAPSPGAGEETL